MRWVLLLLQFLDWYMEAQSQSWKWQDWAWGPECLIQKLVFRNPSWQTPRYLLPARSCLEEYWGGASARVSM